MLKFSGWTIRLCGDPCVPCLEYPSPEFGCQFSNSLKAHGNQHRGGLSIPRVARESGTVDNSLHIHATSRCKFSVVCRTLWHEGLRAQHDADARSPCRCPLCPLAPSAPCPLPALSSPPTPRPSSRRADSCVLRIQARRSTGRAANKEWECQRSNCLP